MSIERQDLVDIAAPRRLSVAMIGCGAIARTVIERLAQDAGFDITSISTTPNGHQSAAAFAESIGLNTQVGRTPSGRQDVLVEAAGHDAVEQHVPAALRAGVPCIISSIGVLCRAGMAETLEAAAREGSTQLELVSGAMGGIDALSAGREGGLRRVVYSGSKPPQAWRGTPAEHSVDLDAIAGQTVLFEGSAREAALLYPKNANVAATVALAGLGLDATRVRLIADALALGNTHRLEAEGEFGHFEMTLVNAPSPRNPKTSLLAAYSIVRALRRRVSSVMC